MCVEWKNTVCTSGGCTAAVGGRWWARDIFKIVRGGVENIICTKCKQLVYIAGDVGDCVICVAIIHSYVGNLASYQNLWTRIVGQDQDVGLMD